MCVQVSESVGVQTAVCLSAAVVSEKWVKNLPHFKGILEQSESVTLFMVAQQV